MVELAANRTEEKKECYYQTYIEVDKIINANTFSTVYEE